MDADRPITPAEDHRQRNTPYPDTESQTFTLFDILLSLTSARSTAITKKRDTKMVTSSVYVDTFVLRQPTKETLCRTGWVLQSLSLRSRGSKLRKKRSGDKELLCQTDRSILKDSCASRIINLRQWFMIQNANLTAELRLESGSLQNRSVQFRSHRRQRSASSWQNIFNSVFNRVMNL